MKSVLLLLTLCAFSTAKYYSFDQREQLQSWIDLIQKVNPNFFQHLQFPDYDEEKSQFVLTGLALERIEEIKLLDPTDNVVDTDKTYASFVTHIALSGLEFTAEKLYVPSVSSKIFTNVKITINRLVYGAGYRIDILGSKCSLIANVGVGDFDGVRFFSNDNSSGQDISADILEKVTPFINRALNRYLPSSPKYVNCFSHSRYFMKYLQSFIKL